MVHARKKALVLVIPMVLALAACGSGGGDTTGTADVSGAQRIVAGGPPADGGASSDEAQRNWQNALPG